MEFDKSRVYTAANADELKAGDVVIVAANVSALKNLVTAYEKKSVGQITTILREDCSCRFCVDTTDISWELAYLVERASEKKWRAYKDCEEMIADFRKRYEKSLGIEGVSVASPMWHPLIWVKNKNFNHKYQIIGFHRDSVTICSSNFDLHTLFQNYTYTDGSPCGVEE